MPSPIFSQRLGCADYRRLTAPFHSLIRITRTMLQIMFVSSLSSSFPLDIQLALAPTRGSTVPRYVLPLPFFHPPSCPAENHLTTVAIQIFPTHVRAKGINIAASAGAIGSIAVGQFFPVAIDKIGSKTYFIFFAVNLVSLVVCRLSPFSLSFMPSLSSPSFSTRNHRISIYDADEC